MTEITSIAQFETALKSMTLPFVLDFHALWCEPCKILNPILQELSTENSEKWCFYKIDTDAFPAIAEKFRVKSVPTIVLISNGTEVARYNGLMWKKPLYEWIMKSLS